ncbi:MAG: glycosyltransferase family 2 protein [Propionibacteriaceae bacterium]|jgi:cellulose synthase/poly-beta-1,6-N-acetylglucosamine synthase-like glycosyltransferase|nr:glycosyltransferase family 2 protein [Propionibacteriaceae bacterium]
MIGVALVICQTLMLIATCYGLYQGFMALPLTPWRKYPPVENEPTNRFAILVFAKNEEPVIGNLLQSLTSQDYPAESYDIFVTADNCTDQTAAKAAEHGAIVAERNDRSHIGKGYALHWFFERFSKEHADRYDACVVFDADNIVEPGFLAAMNRQLNRGNHIALGYRMGKNPTSSWVSGVTTLFWLLQTRFIHRPRVRRGLPCLSVGGTGFMFSLDVLGDGQWQTTSAAEDIEFTLSAIAAGHSVTIATDAIFYDEQPLKFSQSLTQRYRWTVGSFQAMLSCVPKLWKSAKLGRLAKFDALAYAVGVPVAAVSAIAGVVSTLLLLLWTGNWQLLATATAAMAVLAYLGTCWVAWLALRLEKTSWPGDWKAIATFPLFMLSWSVLYVVVLFYRNTTWQTIPHVEAFGLDKVIRRRRPQALAE